VVRGLYGVAVVLAIVGLILRVLPARTPREARSEGTALAAPAPRGTATTSAGSVADATYDSIISANIFSRTRKAPPKPGEVQVQAAPRVVKPAGPTWELVGTTIGPQGTVALIHSSADVPGGELLHHTGDVIAGARLVEITDSTVTLDRPTGGPLVLHLASTQQHKKQ
jgi:hypothetical protein